MDEDDFRMSEPRDKRLLSDNQASVPLISPKGARRISTLKKKPAASSKQMSQRTISEISLESNASFTKEGARVAPEYREIKLMEMMTYYEPKWIAVVGFIASIASACFKDHVCCF